MTLITPKNPGIWNLLAQELASLLDAHGICATVATELAKTTQGAVAVAIYNTPKRLYDVWVSKPGEEKTVQTRWENADTTFVEVANAGKTVYLEKFSRPASEQIQNELWFLPREDILATPLPMPANHFTPKGTICFIDPSPDFPFTPEELDSLGRHITVFLDRAYLRHKSAQQEIEFQVVSDINYALSSSLDLENIYHQLSDPVRRALDVESVSIGLFDQLSQEIIFVNKLMGPQFLDLPPVRVQVGQGIAGYVAQNAEPLIVNRAYDDRRFFSRIDHISGFETNSILCVPLMIENRVIGVMEAINKRSGIFTKSDLRLLQAISGPLAAAIENTNLHLDVVAEQLRIAKMFESMSEGMLTVNRAGLITASNDAFASLLLIPDSDLIGKNLFDIVQSPKDDFEAFVNSVFNQTENNPQLAFELYQSSGKLAPVLVSGTTIEDEGGRIGEAIFVFSDLRQIRELERMRDDFFHNIIHELRTPLATILMYARLLQDGKTEGDIDKQRRFLGVIERESDRLQQMVRQMLEVVKMDAREIQRSFSNVNLNQLFEGFLPALADQATEKGLTFIQKVQSDLPSVKGNEETLYTIFKNLVENAIKFTPSGVVRFSAKSDGEQIVIKVRDEGIGVPRQALPNLFKRFYRSSTAVEKGIAGTGLGLYMTKEGVEKHQGTIEVGSEEGKGATFTVKLPILQE